MTKIRSVAYVCDPEDSDEANRVLSASSALLGIKSSLEWILLPGGKEGGGGGGSGGGGGLICDSLQFSVLPAVFTLLLAPPILPAGLPGSCYSGGCTARQLSLVSEVIAK